jgi:hypothetical protein
MRKGKTTFPHTDEEEGIIQTLHITLSASCSLHIAVLKAFLPHGTHHYMAVKCYTYS